MLAAGVGVGCRDGCRVGGGGGTFQAGGARRVRTGGVVADGAEG